MHEDFIVGKETSTCWCTSTVASSTRGTRTCGRCSVIVGGEVKQGVPSLSEGEITTSF